MKRMMIILQLILALYLWIGYLGYPFFEKHFILKALGEALPEETFFEKLSEGIAIVWALPTFKLLWMILGITIPLMLLNGKERALSTIWLLPFLTLCYAINNRLYAPEAAEITLTFKNYKEPLATLGAYLAWNLGFVYASLDSTRHSPQ